MIELRISRVRSHIVVAVVENGKYVDTAVFSTKEIPELVLYIKRVVLRNVVRA